MNEHTEETLRQAIIDSNPDFIDVLICKDRDDDDITAFMVTTSDGRSFAVLEKTPINVMLPRPQMVVWIINTKYKYLLKDEKSRQG